MVKWIGICVALFVLAIGFIAVTQGAEVAALFNALRSESFLDILAWAIVVLMPLLVLPSAVWLCDTLVRQSRAANALELRLGGVRQGAAELIKGQGDAEAAVRSLVRSDPEDTLGAIQQRLTEAERVVQVQQSRNEIGDLQSRADDLRAQQQSLRDRLAPVLEKRRAIEQIFLELDTRQGDIERALAEIASGDDAVALDLRLKKLGEFVKQGHDRCADIEQASKAIADLKDGFSGLGTRIAPFAAADGITSRVKELGEARDRLGTQIDALQRTPDGSLAQRVQKFAEEAKSLDDGVGQLDVQFSRLAALRGNIEGLFANFDRALDALPIASGSKRAAGIDARVAALSDFIKSTQDHIDDIERKRVAFGQLKARLGDLQSRLVPLESDDGGVVNLIAQVQNMRDRLVAQIGHLEQDENGDLADRVKALTEAKADLEQRVSTVTEHFSKLATIRQDITGLFNKLSGAVGPSSN
jgi:chromosome segregation ATPase